METERGSGIVLIPPSLTLILVKVLTSQGKICRYDILKADISEILLLRIPTLAALHALSCDAARDITKADGSIVRHVIQVIYNERMTYCFTAVYKSVAPSGRITTMSVGGLPFFLIHACPTSRSCCENCLQCSNLLRNVPCKRLPGSHRPGHLPIE